MRETEVAAYPAKLAVRDNLIHGLIATASVTLVSTAGFILVRSTAPAGVEAYDPMFIPVTVAFAFYALYKLVSRNMAQNERNRLQLSQLLRNSVRCELTSPLSLEAADRITSGHVVHMNGYNVWLKKSGAKVFLMTDKVIGVRQLQHF